MRHFTYCVCNHLTLVIKISLVLAVADIRHAASACVAFEPERCAQAGVIQIWNVSVADRLRILPVVDQLVVDVGDGQIPIAIHVVDKVVLELRKVHYAFVKLLDLELSGKQHGTLTFQLVLEIYFEVDRAGVSYCLTLGRVLAAVSHSDPGTRRACVLRVAVVLPGFTRQSVFNGELVARLEWSIGAKINLWRPAPGFRVALVTLVNLQKELNRRLVDRLGHDQTI